MTAKQEAARKTTKPYMKVKVARPSSISLGPDEEYGPAMRALTDNRKRFVIAYVRYARGYHTPDGWHRSAADAARLAGIGGTYRMSKIEGAKLLHNPAVIAAIREVDDAFLRGDLPQNRRVAMAIRDNPGIKPEVRLKAAQWLDATGGRIARTEHHVSHEVTATLSTAEIRRQLAELYQADPGLRQIEGPSLSDQANSANSAIDADFAEIAAESVPVEAGEG